MNDQIVIAGMARTPQGGLQGELSGVPAPQLGAVAIRAALARARVAAAQVDEAIMGCVLPAGLRQAPARQAAIGAGLPVSTGCTTVNKMCGSAMKAVMLGFDALCAGSADCIVAGGMESMSNAPYLALKARSGLRLGHGELVDHVFFDGLEDAYDQGKLMGAYAEDCAGRYGFTRELQDAYAVESLTRARNAIRDGKFDEEIAPVVVKTRKGEVTVNTDEQPGKATIDKIPTLKPAFAKNGTVTPANSSSISDGAAALVLLREGVAKSLGVNPLAVLHAHSTHAQEPGWFTTAPVGAIEKVLKKTGWTVADVDLFEVNEAFAVVAMAAMHDLHIPHDRLNVNGGACALGHPIGASGARIMVTLIAALRDRGLKRGIASLCIGGGEATAVALELIS